MPDKSDASYRIIKQSISKKGISGLAETFPRPLRVFLCHSSGDKPVVRKLYDQLRTVGWIDPWLDVEKLLPGNEWDVEIEKAVEQSDIVIVCLSNKSVDKEGYVQKELRFVLNIAEEKPEGTIFVIPLRLDECVVPRRLRNWQYVDYFPASQRKWAYQRMLESLKVRATRLNLLTDEPKESLTIPHLSTKLRPSHVSKPVTPYTSVFPEPTSSATYLGAAPKSNSIWIYTRWMVILLLILSFLGPWGRALGGNFPFAYFSFLRNVDFAYSLVWPLTTASIGLFLVTLVRLIKWRGRDSKSPTYFERLTVGIISAFTALVFLKATLNPEYVNWGFWLSSLIVLYLAPINILFELGFSMQKGQRWPWWAWLLTLSILLGLLGQSEFLTHWIARSS